MTKMAAGQVVLPSNPPTRPFSSSQPVCVTRRPKLRATARALYIIRRSHSTMVLTSGDPRNRASSSASSRTRKETRLGNLENALIFTSSCFFF